MKPLIIVVLALGVLTIDCFSFPDYVLESERLVAKINQEKQLQKIQKNLETGTDNGGDAVFYLSGNELRKVVIEIGLSNRKVVQCFYYRNNELFLCVETEQRFVWNDTKEALEPTGTAAGTEIRYYFQGKQLEYRVAIDGRKSIERQAELLAREKVLQKESNLFIEAVKLPVVNLEGIIREGSKPNE